MENQTNQAIELVQSAIIKHQLLEISKSVTERINSLNLEKQVVTDETIQTMKKTRANLNKENATYTGQFKAISDLYMQPLNDVKAIFKAEISEKYGEVETLLKDKIGRFEIQIKEEKKNNLIIYFNELILAEKIDFLTFEKMNIEINLSTTENKYKERINEIVSKIKDDLALIKATDFEAEILVEYKKTFNVSKAITEVKARKESEKAESDRLKALEISRRLQEIKKLGMIFVDITNSWEFSDKILFSVDEIGHLSKEEFQTKITTFDVQIKELEAEKKVQIEIEKPKVEIFQSHQITPPATPIEVPKVEKIEPIKKAKFEVQATMSKLRLLGQFMKENGIIYSNIN